MGSSKFFCSVMKTFILFCLFSLSLSSSDIEPRTPQDRALCCAFGSNTCASYCAGRSCSATCSRRCGIFLSDCGSVSCQSVASSTCVAAPTPVATTTTTTTTTTTKACLAVGGDCLNGVNGVTLCCNRPTYDCLPPGVCTAVSV